MAGCTLRFMCLVFFVIHNCCWLNLDLNDEIQLLTRHNAHNFINSYHWMASNSIPKMQPYFDFLQKRKM